MGRKFKRDEKNDVFAERKRERELDKLRRELIKQPEKPYSKSRSNYKPKYRKDN